jgi:hypothetical protein
MILYRNILPKHPLLRQRFDGRQIRRLEKVHHRRDQSIVGFEEGEVVGAVFIPPGCGSVWGKWKCLRDDSSMDIHIQADS